MSFNMTYYKYCVADLHWKILEYSYSATDAGKSYNSLLLRRSDSPVKKSDVFTECFPTAVELENCVSVPVVMSTARRHFACFLRTKSDGAIASSGSSSRQLMPAAYVSNKPLAVVAKAVAGTEQVENRMKNEQGICDAVLKRRNFERVQSNSTQWPMFTQDTEVVAKSVRREYGRSVESGSSQQKLPKPSKNVDRDLPSKSSLVLQSPAKSGDGLRQLSTMCWNGNRGVAGSSKTSVASAVMMQDMPTAGQPNVNTPEITCCTAVPLSTSNIVNINRPCPAAGQNSTGIQRHVIIIKRRQILPST